MADLNEIQSSGSVKIAGSDASSNESNYADVSANREIKAHDVFDNGWITSTISIAAGATAELKVGGSVLASRKGIFLQAKDKDITFGHSITILPFDAFKNQFFSLPIGDGTSVFLKNNGALSADVAIGELA